VLKKTLVRQIKKVSEGIEAQHTSKLELAHTVSPPQKYGINQNT
jgi:hypothetical protein